MSDLERIAYHEAGHATAAHLLKRAPGVVTIEPTEAYGGLACHGGGRLPARIGLGPPLPLIPAMTRRYIETEVVIALAGPETERLRWHETGYRPVTPDEEYATELVGTLVTPSLAAPRPTERERLTKAAAEPRESDEDIAVSLATALAGENLAVSYLSFLRAVATNLVSAPEFQRGVEGLVPHLLEHRTLSARSVRAVLSNGRRTNNADL